MQKEPWQYFSTPDLSGLVQQLRHLSLFSANALVVEGESGSGKTVVLSALVSSLEAQHVDAELSIAQVTLQDHYELSEVLSGIGQSLGLALDVQDVGAMLIQLRSFSERLIAEGRIAVVLVDDAHFLEDDALGATLSLLSHRANPGFGLRIVFFAEPGLMPRIDGMSEPELSIYDFQLTPFSTVELERFLSERFEGFDSLSEAGKLPSIAAIWNRSGGKPGLALEIVQDQLDLKSKTSSAADFKGVPILHLGLLSLLLACLLVTLFYRGDKKNSVNSEHRSVELIAPESTVSAGAKEPRSASILEPSSESAFEEKDINSPSSEAAAQSDPESANPSNIIVADVEASAAANDDSSGTSGNDKVIDSGSVLAVSESNLVPEIAEAEAQSVVESSSSTELALLAEKEPESQPSSVSKTEDKLSDSSRALSSSELFLLGQAPGAYLLQLVAASQEESLLAYMNEQANKDILHMYRRVREPSGHWYVVVIGPFVSKREAELARASLPDAQREAGPWPKSMQAVHAEIAAFRDR